MWVASELYYPEETSTGYVLTRIAEGLAGDFDVRVLCGQPSYEARGLRAPLREFWHGVHIRRCWASRFDRRNLALRAVNLLTVTGSIFLAAALNIRRGDTVLVVTNPPLLPLALVVACRLRGARSVLLIHDVYPEALLAAGLISPGSRTARALARLSRWLWRSVDRIIVVGRDMQRLVSSRAGPGGPRVVVIPNWADVDEVSPRPRESNTLLRELGLAHKFVVQFAGNIGRVQGLDDLVEAADRLRSTNEVHFLVIGSGARRPWLEDIVRRRGLTNATVLPARPRDEQMNFLNACDVALISLAPGMLGAGVPSRLYNVLAAGKPVVAVADEASELATVVREEQIGWIVSPGRPDAVAEAILDARRDPKRLTAMGARARTAALGKYSFPAAIASYRALLRSVAGASTAQERSPAAPEGR